jgi:cold shock protein
LGTTQFEKSSWNNWTSTLVSPTDSAMRRALGFITSGP